MKDISVIIVTFNNASTIEKLILSLDKYLPNSPVFLIDNNSVDNTNMIVANYMEKFAKVHFSDKNLGFAKAVNFMWREVETDFVLLLNPDAELIDDSLRKIIDDFKNSDKIGIIGGKILNEDDTIQPSVRKLPKFSDQALLLSKLTNFFPRLIADYSCMDFDYSQRQYVEQVMGACFAVRRELWEKIGFLDEGFWLWYEEVDYCAMALENGYKILYNPEICVKHLRGVSFAPLTFQKRQRILNNSLSYYAKKHFSQFGYLVLRVIMIYSLLISIILDKFRYLSQYKNDYFQKK